MMDYRGFNNIPRRVYVKYALVNLIDIVLLVVILVLACNWINIPAWFFWTVIGLSLAKDVILFPFVWGSYDSRDQGRMRSIIGQRGIALEPLAPEGYIRVQGELWKAGTVNGCPPIGKGETVRVENVQGLKVFVIPDNADTK